ncbi:MAG: TonB-dependent receptor [Litorilituus sp.]|nr:TonB-dependent receptor [Litorilituus sp.]
MMKKLTVKKYLTHPPLMSSAIRFSFSKLSGALLIATLPLAQVLANDKVDDVSNGETIDYIERMRIIGHGDNLRTEAGSATLIGETELEKFKFDDINRILANIPGINLREEDGYGLRPNIGFRGATPERSKKITIMEDGILSGPAPYSAPPAYYFPMMSKMTSVEVFKGPAAIKYGPNTVAGALNMTTRAVPSAQEGMFDLAVGSDAYSNVHGYYGDTVGNLGFLVEAINMQSGGFKELDGGGDTGFDKSDIMTKFRYDVSSGSMEHTFELKLAYAEEKSNETYLGLTDDDFAKAPNRRYLTSQKDVMDWQHQQIQFSHFMQTGDFDITTRLYRNNFERSWFKVNNFKDGTSIEKVLLNPEVNDQYYQVLIGQSDSQNEGQKIILGDNARQYYSQGIQSELYWQQRLFGLDHEFNVGGRFHQDQIERNHTTDAFMMSASQLVSDGSAQVATTTDREKTSALSVFVKDTVSYDALKVTLGLRGEFIDAHYQNRALGKENDWLKKKSHIWLPSLSVFYTLNSRAGLLFGVHEGFIPTSPKQDPKVDIENSINYEFGGRYNNGNAKVEAIVFYNDISNLKESCSFSQGAACGGEDTEHNAGEVDVYGLEFTAHYQVELTAQLDMPVSVVYTLSDSEFKNSFESEFPMWGKIEAGDSLPYLPQNQLTVNIGVTADNWDVNLIARYVDSMLEASGVKTESVSLPLEGYQTKAHTIVDFSASYYLGDWGKVYLKADNILDEQQIVSRRPYGARPGKPQQLFIGYQYSF